MSEDDIEGYFEALFGGRGAPKLRDDEVLAEYGALLRGELPEEETKRDTVGPVMPWDDVRLVGDATPGVPLAHEAQIGMFPITRGARHSLAEKEVRCLADLLSADISTVPRIGEKTRIELLRFMLLRSRRVPHAPQWARTWQLDTELGSALFFLDQAGTLCCSPARLGGMARPEELESLVHSSGVADFAAIYLAGRGYRIYESSLKAWLCSLDKLPTGLHELPCALDALVSSGDLRETFELGCECAIATWYEGQEDLGEKSGRSWTYCFPDAPWWKRAAHDFVRERHTLVFDEEECEIRFRSLTLDEYLASTDSSRFAAFRLYLGGRTFREVGEVLGCSHERARQLVLDDLNRVPPLKEDALVPLVENRRIGWSQFKQLACANRRVFSYLELWRTREGDRAPIELASSDDEVSEEARKRISRSAVAVRCMADVDVKEELMRVWRRLRKERGSIECSARLAFELYPALMEKIGVKDEFELFELSKEVLANRQRTVRFGPEVPIVKFGYCSRTAQIYQVIKRLEPATENHLFEEYFKLYRVEREAFHGYLVDEFSCYRDECGVYHATKQR